MRLLCLLLGLIILGCNDQSSLKIFQQAQQHYQVNEFKEARSLLKELVEEKQFEARIQFLLALMATKENNVAGAIHHLQRAEQSTSDLLLQNRIVAQYIELNQLDAASSLLDKVLQKHHNDLEARALMAWLQYMHGNHEGAHETAKAVLAENPASVRAVAVLAAYYADTNDISTAMDIVGNALESQSENESLQLVKIRLMQQQGDVEGVVTGFHHLIQDNPRNLMYPYQLATFYLSEQSMPVGERKDEAERVLRELVAEQPTETVTKVWLVEFLLNNRGAAVGELELKTFIDESPDDFTLRGMLAEFYLSGSEPAKADEVYLPLITDQNKDAVAQTARERLLDIAVLRNDRERVLYWVDELLARDSYNIKALTARARVQVADGETTPALAALETVLDKKPTSESALLLLAQIREQQGDWEAAAQAYRRVLTVDDMQSDALLGLARTLMQDDSSINESQQLLSRLLSKEPINVDAISAMGELYARSSRWGDALEMAAKLQNIDGQMAAAHYLRGRIFLRQKDFKRAIAALEESLAIDDRQEEPLSALISAFMATDRATEAETYLRDYLRRRPNDAQATELLAVVSLQSGNRDAALALLNDLLLREPSRLSVYRILGRIYSGEGNFDKLESAYLYGLEKSPDNPALLSLLAEQYRLAGATEPALKIYEKLLQMNPNSRVIKNNMAGVLLDVQGPDSLSRAAALADDLADSDVPAFLDTAGWVHYQQGDYRKAVALLRAALDKGGMSPVFHYHLGMAYFRIGESSLAKLELAKALGDEQFHFNGIDEARNTLKELSPASTRG